MKIFFTLLLTYWASINLSKAQDVSLPVKSTPGIALNAKSTAGSEKTRTGYICRVTAPAPSASPILVIDGIVSELSELKKLDPNDVDSIYILKESEASAIFGCWRATGVIIITTKTAYNRKFIIKDFLTGENIPRATISFASATDVIKTTADDNGVLVMDKLKHGLRYDVIVSSTGYKSFTTAVKGKEQEILLERDMKLCDEVVVVGYGTIRCSRTLECTNTRISHCTLEKRSDTVYTTISDASKRSVLLNFSVYPNPVRRSNAVNIGFKSEEEKIVQLAVFSLNGQQMTMQSQKISKGLNKISVAVDPKWAAGIYNIQLRNERGTLIRQEKIVVQ